MHRETETGLPILSQLKVEERRDRKPDSGRQDRIFWGWMNYRLAASSLLIRSACSGVKVSSATSFRRLARKLFRQAASTS